MLLVIPGFHTSHVAAVRAVAMLLTGARSAPARLLKVNATRTVRNVKARQDSPMFHTLAVAMVNALAQLLIGARCVFQNPPAVAAASAMVAVLAQTKLAIHQASVAKEHQENQQCPTSVAAPVTNAQERTTNGERSASRRAAIVVAVVSCRDWAAGRVMEDGTQRVGAIFSCFHCILVVRRILISRCSSVLVERSITA